MTRKLFLLNSKMYSTDQQQSEFNAQHEQNYSYSHSLNGFFWYVLSEHSQRSRFLIGGLLQPARPLSLPNLKAGQASTRPGQAGPGGPGAGIHLRRPSVHISKSRRAALKNGGSKLDFQTSGIPALTQAFARPVHWAPCAQCPMTPPLFAKNNRRWDCLGQLCYWSF